MRHASPLRALLPFAVLTACLASGCGGGQGPKLQGRLLMNGAPYKLSEGEEFLLTFASGDLQSENVIRATAEVKEDGTFTVAGPDGEGVPPGTYVIGATSRPYQSAGSGDDEDEDGEETELDKFRGQFGLANTPLKVEVTSDTGEITIDLGKGTVTQ